MHPRSYRARDEHARLRTDRGGPVSRLPPRPTKSADRAGGARRAGSPHAATGFAFVLLLARVGALLIVMRR
jgi:hypothetical protein